MPKLNWNKEAFRFYESGSSHVALYVHNKTPHTFYVTKPNGTLIDITTSYYDAVAWNGVTGFTVNATGGESNPIYANNEKYVNIISPEFYGGTIEAYTYPDEFGRCDGSITTSGGAEVHQQKRSMFSIVCMTKIGNAPNGLDFGEKIHILYNATATPAERPYTTINDSPEAITFSWEFQTHLAEGGTIDNVTYKGASYLVLDSRKLCMDKTDSGYIPNAVKKSKWDAFKTLLFGRSGTGTDSNGYLPMPPEIIAYFLDGGTGPTPVYDGNAYTSLESLLAGDTGNVIVRGYTDGDREYTDRGHTYRQPVNPRIIVTMPDLTSKQVGFYLPYERDLETGEPVDGDSSGGAFHLETVTHNGEDVTYIMIRSTFSGLPDNIYMVYSDYIDAVCGTFHFNPVWESQSSAVYAVGEHHDQSVAVLAAGDASDVLNYRTYPMGFTNSPSRDENGYSWNDYYHDPELLYDGKVVRIGYTVTRADQQVIELAAEANYRAKYGVDWRWSPTDYSHNLATSPVLLEDSYIYLTYEAYQDWCTYTGMVIPTTNT